MIASVLVRSMVLLVDRCNDSLARFNGLLVRSMVLVAASAARA